MSNFIMNVNSISSSLEDAPAHASGLNSPHFGSELNSPFRLELNTLRSVPDLSDSGEIHYQRGIRPCRPFDLWNREFFFTGDEDGDNQLHISIAINNEEVALKLIDLAPSADYINKGNNLLQTALHLAVLAEMPGIVRRLMCAGALVNLQDAVGNTALHQACILGHYEIARLLTKPVEQSETAGNMYRIPTQRIPQDMSFKNNSDLSCPEILYKNKHHDILRLLINCGAEDVQKYASTDVADYYPQKEKIDLQALGIVLKPSQAV